MTKNKAPNLAPIVECDESKAERMDPVECLKLLRLALYDCKQAMASIPGWRPRCLTRTTAFLSKLDD